MLDEILPAYAINFNRGGVVPLGGKSETYFRRSKRFIYIYIYMYLLISLIVIFKVSRTTKRGEKSLVENEATKRVSSCSKECKLTTRRRMDDERNIAIVFGKGRREREKRTKMERFRNWKE